MSRPQTLLLCALGPVGAQVVALTNPIRVVLQTKTCHRPDLPPISIPSNHTPTPSELHHPLQSLPTPPPPHPLKLHPMTILQGPAPPHRVRACPTLFCPQMPWDPALPILSASRATSSLKSQHYPLTFPSAPSTAVPCAFGWAHRLLLHLGLKGPSDVP